MTSGHRSDLLPLRLEALDQLRGLVPGGGLCEARDLRAQAPLLLEVLGEIRVGTLAQLVARGTETLPEALRLVCRRARDGRPFLVESPELARYLGEVVRFEERLGTSDDLLLRRDVRPAPPFVGLFRLSEPSQELVPRLGHPLDPRRPPLRRRERPGVGDHRLRLLELAPRDLRVERFGVRQIMQPGAEGLEPRHVLALRFAAPSVRLVLPPRELLARALEPPPQCDGIGDLGGRRCERGPTLLERLPRLLGGHGYGGSQGLGLYDHRLELCQQRLTGTPLLAARRRVLASQPEATRQRCDPVVGHGCEPVPCGHRIVEGTRCGGVVEPFDALAERGTHCEVLLQRTPGGLSFVLAARAAPGLVEDLIAGLVEPMRHVFPGLDVTRDTRPLLLDGTDLLGRLEEVARDGQLLDHETELELPGASLLHADREPIARARGQERPGSLADALRGGAAVGDRAQHGRVGDPLERLQCEIGSAVADRDAPQDRRVLDARERGASDHGIRCVPDDVAQHAIAGRTREGGVSDGLVCCGHRNRREAVFVGKARERRLAFGERPVGAGHCRPDLPGALGGEGAQALVGLALCQAVEPLGVFELLDGNAPNPRIRIAPRDRFQARLVTDAHLPYRRGPDLGVGSTPAGP